MLSCPCSVLICKTYSCSLVPTNSINSFFMCVGHRCCAHIGAENISGLEKSHFYISHWEGWAHILHAKDQFPSHCKADGFSVGQGSAMPHWWPISVVSAVQPRRSWLLQTLFTFPHKLTLPDKVRSSPEGEEAPDATHSKHNFLSSP